MTEILGEAIAELQVHECPEDENGEPECADEETAEKRAVQYGTLLFFAGCFIVFVLDMVRFLNSLYFLEAFIQNCWIHFEYNVVAI